MFSEVGRSKNGMIFIIPFFISGLALLLSCSLWPPAPFYTFTNFGRWVELITLLCYVAFGLDSPKQTFVDIRPVSESYRTEVGICYFILIVMVVVGLTSEYPSQSLQDTGRYALILLAVNRLIILLKKHSNLMLQLARFWLVAMYSFLLFYFIDWFMKLQTGYSASSSVGNFGNPRQYADLACITVPVLFYGSIAEKTRFLKFVFGFGAIGCLAALMQSGGRGGIIAILASSALIWTVKNYPIKKMLMLFLWGFVAYLFLNVTIPFVLDIAPAINAARFGASGRIELWMFSLTQVYRCFFGCGGQSFAALTKEFYFPPFGGPHNIVLSFAIEYGFFVCFAVLVLGVRNITCILEFFKRAPVGASIPIVAIIFHSLVARAQDSPFIGMLMPPLLAVGMVACEGDKKLVRLSRRPISSGVSHKDWSGEFSAALFALGLVGIILSFLDFYFFSTLAFGETAYPRFFSDGSYYVSPALREN